MSRTHSASLCSILLLAGCLGTDVGNPPEDERRVTATLEFAVYDDSSPDDTDDPAEDGRGDEANVAENANPRGLVVTGGTDVEQVWLSIESIVVTPASDCTTEAERRIEGPLTVELFSGEVLPEAPVLTTEPAEFCEVTVQLAPVPAAELPEGSPDGLNDQSLWLTATTAEGDPVTLGSTTRRALPYVGDGFRIDGEDGSRQQYIAVFEPMTWFENLNLRSDAGAPVELDEMTSPADLAAFWSSFSTNSRVVHDADGDGLASPDEFAAPVGVPR